MKATWSLGKASSTCFANQKAQIISAIALSEYKDKYEFIEGNYLQRKQIYQLAFSPLS